MNALFTLINTKLFRKALRAKPLESEDLWIPIYKDKVDRAEMRRLIQDKAVAVREDENYYHFQPLKVGDVDLSLIYKKKEFSPFYKAIRDNLLRCDLTIGNLDPKIEAFFKLRHQYLDLFFTIDNFSGRIHTPITTMSKDQRELLLIDGSPTCSIDVATMQPLVLGKVLEKLVGENDFSNWINQGEDIYKILQDKAGLATRKAAKKLFFKISFGKSADDLIKHFGQADWVKAIIEIKSHKITENPSYEDKPHSNLSWMLQKYEVNVMSKVWSKLLARDIPFLTVHDEVICKLSDLKQTEQVFHDVLSHEFRSYKIKITSHEDREELWWFFLDEKLPNGPIKLLDGTIVEDADDFVASRVNSLEVDENYKELKILREYLEAETKE